MVIRPKNDKNIINKFLVTRGIAPGRIGLMKQGMGTRLSSELPGQVKAARKRSGLRVGYTPTGEN